METIKEWTKTCLSKVRMSEAHADDLIMRVWNEDKVELRKYYCPHCSGYHVTSKKKWIQFK